MKLIHQKELLTFCRFSGNVEESKDKSNWDSSLCLLLFSLKDFWEYNTNEDAWMWYEIGKNSKTIWTDTWNDPFVSKPEYEEPVYFGQTYTSNTIIIPAQITYHYPVHYEET